MAITGGCRCGAIRYSAEAQPHHQALCWCADCRRSAGATPVGWMLFDQDAVAISGEVRSYASPPNVTRQFCGTCGTGLFYLNAKMFPGQVDVQMGTLDQVDALAPQASIQAAEAPAWMEGLADLPRFERYPGP
jgi:hypothetical protein